MRQRHERKREKREDVYEREQQPLKVYGRGAGNVGTSYYIMYTVQPLIRKLSFLGSTRLLLLRRVPAPPRYTLP